MSNLKNLPSVDAVKQLAKKNYPSINDFVLSSAVRQLLDEIRAKNSPLPQKNTIEGEEFLLELSKRAVDLTHELERFNLRPVVNATGIVLHTNLGRAPMPLEVTKNIASVAENYSTLEYNLETGDRGSRYSHIEQLICKITGAEAAVVVNNNAAAVLLILSALSKKPKNEVIVSRGELVEIGGSFRIPDIMSLGGAILKEVGTTNKTKLHDYEGAISKKTAAILKVHTSNFKLIGFCHEEEIADLKKVSVKNKIPLIYDFGSGMLDEYEPRLVGEEPVLSAIKNGVDVICFSGDKLLGGPQCGIIAGKKELVDRIKKHQLTRVLRVDKLCLAALEPLFRLYMDKDMARLKIPVLKMLSYNGDELKERAQNLCDLIKGDMASHLEIRIVDMDSQVGGGSAPTLDLASYGIEIYSHKLKVNEIEKRLRANEIPIITRIKNDRILMDVRTIFDNQFDIIKNAIELLVV